MTQPTWNPMRQAFDRPSSLAEFLLARIADEERIARAADDGSRIRMAVYNNLSSYAHDVVFVAKFNPARVLAECEAKRRIVELHEHPDGSCWEMHRGVYGPGWPEGSYAVEGQSWSHPSLESPDVHPGPCETLQLLALSYAGHPAYRPEWRP